MTKEGELTKRIKALDEPVWHEVYDTIIIRNSSLDNVVDEAKKDFPNFVIPDLIIDTYPQIVHFEYEKLKQLLKWKKNWFGDST